MIRKVLIATATLAMFSAVPVFAQADNEECHSYVEFLKDVQVQAPNSKVEVYEGDDAAKIIDAVKEQAENARGNRVAVIETEQYGAVIALMQGDCLTVIGKMPNEVAEQFLKATLGGFHKSEFRF